MTDQSFNYFTAIEAAFTKAFQAGGGAIAGKDLITSGARIRLHGLQDRRSGLEGRVRLRERYYPEVAAFIKQAREAGIKAPMVGNSAYGFRSLPQADRKR